MQGGGLLRFDVEGGVREELEGAGAEVEGVIGASDDGSYVYFVAETPGGGTKLYTGT